MLTARRTQQILSLFSLLPLAGLASCSLGAPAATQGQARFEQFVQSDARSMAMDATLAPTACDAACRQHRQDFRYVVYVGKQIYAYWEEKKADTGLDFDELARSMEQSITTSTSNTDYYQLLRRWAAAFHDGHVNVLGKEDDSDMEIYTAPVRLETLAPATDHEKIIVAQTSSSTVLTSPLDLKVGDEVLAINGVKASAALDEAEKITSGSTRRMRRFFGVRKLVDTMGVRDGAAPLVLSVQTPNESDTREVTLYRTAELKARPAAPSATEAAAEETGLKNFKAMMLPGGMGYLRIDAFSGSQSTFLLDEAMQRLSNTRGLLIDLRKNGGGDQSGNAILSRLASSSITRYQTSERMDNFIIASRPEYFQLPWTPGDLFAQWHNIRVSPPADPSKLYVNKPVIALTSPNCFSACDTFASALKANHLATMVGEATGGGTGTPLVFKLPLSGMDFRYGVVRGRTATGEPIEGVGTAPDTVIEPTQTERAKGQDQELLSALGMLIKQIEERGNPAGPAPSSQVMNNALSAAISELGPVWAQELGLSPSRSEAKALRKVSIFDLR